jgi:hypothetical protein
VANYLELIKAIGPYVKAGGEIAASAAENRAKGRAAEAVAGQAQDRNATDRYRSEQQAKVAAAQLLENATQDRADRYLTDAQARAKQVAFGDVLSNLQDVNIGGLPSYIPNIGISGGLRPSALGANARQAGRSLSQSALEAQLSGSDIPNLPNVSGLGTDAPALTELPQSGKLDSILNMLGYAGAGAGAYEEIQKQRRAQGLPPEAGVPRWDMAGAPGTQVPLSALDQRVGAVSPGYGGAGRANLVQALNAMAQAAKRSGGPYGGE